MRGRTIDLWVEKSKPLPGEGSELQIADQLVEVIGRNISVAVGTEGEQIPSEAFGAFQTMANIRTHKTCRSKFRDEATARQTSPRSSILLVDKIADAIQQHFGLDRSVSQELFGLRLWNIPAHNRPTLRRAFDPNPQEQDCRRDHADPSRVRP